GREITHQELGLALLQRLRDELADEIMVEQFPKLEGRQMVMMIAPARKKPGANKQSKAAHTSAPAAASAPPAAPVPSEVAPAATTPHVQDAS
ncbi:MAG: translation initiation factor IF-3, partial [Burkholderiaceae bacterium]